MSISSRDGQTYGHCNQPFQGEILTNPGFLAKRQSYFACFPALIKYYLNAYY
jgi:hypothetical protein